MNQIDLILDLLLLFVTFFLTFFLYPYWINFVYKFQLGDVSRVHKEKSGTPTMGGFIFVLTVTIITLLLNRSRIQTLLPVFIATSAGLLGLLEDFAKVYYKSELPSFLKRNFGWLFKSEENPVEKVQNVLKKPKAAFKEFWRIVGSSSGSGIDTYKKFLIEGSLAGFLAYWTYFKLGWDYIWLPLIGDVHVGILYPVMIFVFFIVVINSVNFSDGVDGLAGGLALISFISFWVISRSLGYYSLAGFCATFVGALLPFLYFNFYPSRIFMGNVGSHALGAVLVVLAVVMHREVPFLLICLVFLIDGITSPIQQWSVKLTKKRLFRMAPIHHHFEKLGWPESKVALRFWLFGAFFAFAGVFAAIL